MNLLNLQTNGVTLQKEMEIFYSKHRQHEEHDTKWTLQFYLPTYKELDHFILSYYGHVQISVLNCRKPENCSLLR